MRTAVFSPLELLKEVAERYRRYLYTTFYFRDPVLRASFRQALESTNLVQGPYLEVARPFPLGVGAEQLLEDLLEEPPDDGFLEAIHGTRPLYRHQEEAIRRVFRQRNVVVATGTGSGKTEAFLLPILFHLYQEFRKGKLGPGIRAMILYPMNALAYDQRDRLGEIARRLQEAGSPFRFTFGQYIGDTPEDERDTRREAQAHLGEHRLPGELVLRSEMRETPPHILLTNYSMLEYLLIRPKDSFLFTDTGARHWTYLVLDEAHQYRGARGMEMAMLIRRLKERLREGGKKGPFCCLATSATLLEGEQDREATAQFATTLFGEPFGPEDVITGKVRPPAEEERPPENKRYELTPADYASMLDALNAPADEARQYLVKLARLKGVPGFPGEDPGTVCGCLLAHDRRAHQLRQLSVGEPQPVVAIAQELFPEIKDEEARVGVLGTLVALLMQTSAAGADRTKSTGSPFLAARYHFFLRSLDGAFIRYRGGRQILLERTASPEATVFEVALCRECGQHYLVGRIQGDGRQGRLVEAVRDPSHPEFGATFFRPLEAPEFLKSGEEDEEWTAPGGRQRYALCVQCRAIWLAGLQPLCAHEEILTVERQDAAREGEDQIPRCSACGYKAPDPVREVVHGTDGPHTVITTTLYQRLPEKRKKILAFADSRQEAAFFSWYLDRTYRDLLTRNLVWQAGRALGQRTREGLSLADLAGEYYRLLRDCQLAAPYASETELRKEASIAVCREFLTEEKRISLEGVGLGYWSIRWPDWYGIPEVLQATPWRLGTEEAMELLQVLFHLLRDQGAVELRLEGAAVPVAWDDLHVNRPQQRVRLGPPRGEKGMCSWDGVRGGRARLLKKILVADGMEDQRAAQEAGACLRTIWETLLAYERSAPETAYRLLLPAANDAWRVNSAWWRFHVVLPEATLCRCDTCGRIGVWSVAGLCSRTACPGRMVRVSASELTDNHYRYLYQSTFPGKLRVEEHTAQLGRKKAREYQEAFKEGQIHLLSCSTTFELGVDLGDLDTVFLRNTPPEAFNYAQRVGRAGRRPGWPGVAITYCRRSPHDLYHFADPGHILRGSTKPPVLRLTNPKIVLRHVAAVALSSFFRRYPERFASVQKLCGDLEQPTLVVDLRAFLQKRRREIEPVLQRIVPEEGDLHAVLGLGDGKWIDLLTTESLEREEPRLVLGEVEVAGDYRNLLDLEARFSAKRDHRTAEWAGNRAETIAREDVLSFLSRKAVIPKYGFPVDVVELDTRLCRTNEGENLQLQRDLKVAIAEFAPTSELVANKKLWTSYGLKRVAEREWDVRYYRRCPEHKRYDVWKPTETPPAPCCPAMGGQERFLIPRFGFVISREKPKEPRHRPVRMFSTRPFFAGFQGPDRESIAMPAANPLLTASRARPGEMGVICEGRRGRGFWICPKCGAGFLKNKTMHSTPLGERCAGSLQRVALGHLFVTTWCRSVSIFPRRSG
ncbi:MAG: DEAD/DEAH box helicase [Bacillota bacterium]|nr:DEAD/DEAH box helicase [Bacillota bacterium]